MHGVQSDRYLMHWDCYLMHRDSGITYHQDETVPDASVSTDCSVAVLIDQCLLLWSSG